MTRISTLTAVFVEFVPETVLDGHIYISLEYGTAVHRCCCGCGNEVVTPLSPTDWRVIYDGKTVSLDPSIGNWSFPCQSHYWIRNNRVRWARRWTREEIEAGRANDRAVKAGHYDWITARTDEVDEQPADRPVTWWSRMWARATRNQ